MSEKVSVLVVDDSPFVCRLMTSFLQSSPLIQVVGTALNGARAVELVRTTRPDAVTMDLEMPVMNGLQALEVIMRHTPTPVVVITGASRKAADTTMLALKLGAVDFLLKYAPGQDVDPVVLRTEMIAKVLAASRVRVVRTVSSGDTANPDLKPSFRPKSITQNAGEVPSLHQHQAAGLLPGGVVIIGASTGGPLAIRELLERLPWEFDSAILIVQHLPPAFTSVLAAQLGRHTQLSVKEARQGDRLLPGRVLIAPGAYHLLVTAHSRVILNQGPPIKGHRPSISVTMQSAAQIYGSRTRGVLLTGMGDDGGQGLLAIRAKGGTTFVQEAETCLIDGMPQRAIEKGVVDHIASPHKIADLLASQQPYLLKTVVTP